MEKMMLENSNFEVLVASNEYAIHEKYFAVGNTPEPVLNSYFSTHCSAFNDMKFYPSTKLVLKSTLNVSNVTCK